MVLSQYVPSVSVTLVLDDGELSFFGFVDVSDSFLERSSAPPEQTDMKSIALIRRAPEVGFLTKRRNQQSIYQNS